MITHPCLNLYTKGVRLLTHTNTREYTSMRKFSLQRCRTHKQMWIHTRYGISTLKEDRMLGHANKCEHTLIMELQHTWKIGCYDAQTNVSTHPLWNFYTQGRQNARMHKQMWTHTHYGMLTHTHYGISTHKEDRILGIPTHDEISTHMEEGAVILAAALWTAIIQAQAHTLVEHSYKCHLQVQTFSINW